MKPKDNGSSMYSTIDKRATPGLYGASHEASPLSTNKVGQSARVNQKIVIDALPNQA